jgi:hypothetical protein
MIGWLILLAAYWLFIEQMGIEMQNAVEVPPDEDF